MKNLSFLIPLFLIWPLCHVWAQEEGMDDPDSSGIEKNRLLPTSTPVLLFSEAGTDEKEKEKEKKKKKKNFYFGEKTKKSLIRTSFRDQVTFQVFHYTRRNQEVDPYIRDIYWFDKKNRTIKNKNFHPSKGYLLHGPYEKRIGENVVETGMFYFGTKHGRWLTYDNKNILINKSHFSQGWPKESRVTYYNREEKKIEKLTPIEYNLKEGNFYHFYQNGQLAVIGEFHFGEKVGLWTEYWNLNGEQTIRRREIQYQEEPFTKDFKPFIKAEWDKEGNLVYRNEI